MAGPAGRFATYEDVLSAPEHIVAEVLNGELSTSRRPAGPHAEAASVLGMDVGGAFHRGRGGPAIARACLAFLMPRSSSWRRIGRAK